MSDGAEFQWSALDFDPLLSQPALVSQFDTTASAAGYYTPAQIQALQVDTPLLTHDGAGNFTLTIGVEKSTDLSNFIPFPMLPPGTATINPAGKLEDSFTSPENAEFFRLQSE